MATNEPRNGDVLRYAYLWRREHEKGEDAGRKLRPACVTLLLSDSGNTRLLLFPMTSQPPGSDRAALEIPQAELTRIRLKGPCWLILDECNLNIWESSFYLADRRTLGRFSYPFFDRYQRNSREGASGAQARSGSTPVAADSHPRPQTANI